MITADREWKASDEMIALTGSRYFKALERKEQELSTLHRKAISFHKLEADGDV